MLIMLALPPPPQMTLLMLVWDPQRVIWRSFIKGGFHIFRGFPWSNIPPPRKIGLRRSSHPILGGFSEGNVVAHPVGPTSLDPTP